MSDDAITPKRKKKTIREHLLVEIELDENGALYKIKNVLPMPPLARGGEPMPEKVRKACRKLAKAGDRSYEGKLLMVLHYTSNPFFLTSEVVYTANDKAISKKSGGNNKE
jgi:hypothetical protein